MYAIDDSAVDLDGSGKIEFDEFVVIMSRLQKSKGSNSDKSAMYDFFQSTFQMT